MSVMACAELVAAGDPDRFAATMAAPVAARAVLWPIYAVNLEIARAPWASAEPMVAEMRLQWWINTIGELAEGEGRAGHPVTEALLPVLAARPRIAPLLAGIAEARRWDCWREPHADEAAFQTYLDRTAGNLMWAAASALGAEGSAEAPVRDFAAAAGLAAYLRAVPELEARGCRPLPDGRPDAVGALARAGLARHRAATGARHLVPRQAVPALWTGWQARALLRQVAAEPGRVADGRMGLSDIARRGGLLIRAFTGRW